MNLSLHWKAKRDLEEAVQLKNRYDQWDAETTPLVQLERLQRVWADAIQDVPYYEELVSTGQAPEEINDWDDFQQIPVLSRATLQDNPNAFVRRSRPPDFHRMTGGSTGTPVHFGVWHSEDRLIRQLKLTLWLKMDYRIQDRLFLIWGHSHLLGTGWRKHVNHVKRLLKDRIMHYRRVDAYRLDRDVCRDYARQLLSFRPRGLIGYCSALDLFIRYNPEATAAFEQLDLKFIQPCAEPPPRADSFALFHSTFQCPVIQEFGGVDFGQVASQVNEEPYFVFPDQNILESVPSAKSDNEEGVLVTTLYPRYLPLIRYSQGDAITNPVKDPHGHVRAFDSIQGRINDMLQMPSGDKIHSVAIFHSIHQEQEVFNIQLLLDDAGYRLLLASRRPALSSEAEKRIRHRLGQVSSDLKEIPIELVADVETNRAGKRRWFIDRRTTSSN